MPDTQFILKEGRRMTSSSPSCLRAHVNQVWKAGVHLLQETAWDSCKINWEIALLPAAFSESTESCVAELLFSLLFSVNRIIFSGSLRVV